MGLFSFLFAGANNLREAILQDAVIIDVRPPYLYDQGKVPGSLAWDLGGSSQPSPRDHSRSYFPTDPQVESIPGSKCRESQDHSRCCQGQRCKTDLCHLFAESRGRYEESQSGC